MRFRGQILPQVLCALALAALALRADPGDVESSHDYAGFPRLPGYVITDYDEDNPAQFDFPVARPLPDDADHVETVHVKGHRYAIRYELEPGGRSPTLFETQQHYEKLAAKAGFKMEKSGAIGDVTETFHRVAGAHETWVYLEPAVTANVLTVMESATSAAAPALAHAITVPPATPAIVHAITVPPPAPAIVHAITVPPPAPTSVHAIVPTPPPQPPPAPPAAPSIDPNDDSLYTSLSQNGRVVLPFVFQPGRDELDASSQPLIDRVVAMMKRHPDLFLRIEGHTDNTGDPEDNMRLSAQRALAVQAMLVAAHIGKERLDAVGVGGLQPLADNGTAQGREKNRRIELVMWKKHSVFHPPAPNGHN